MNVVTTHATGLLAAMSAADSPPVAAREDWQSNIRLAVLAAVADFVAARCTPDLNRAGFGAVGEVLVEFVAGSKCLRSALMYVGWLCGAAPSSAALSAAASLELLHAFALL